MGEGSLVANDYQYITIYLKDIDPITGSITHHDVTSATPINFRMKKSGSTANALDTTMTIVTAALGEVRTTNPVTIPPVGRYTSEIEVTQGGQTITWTGPYFNVVKELG